ncbi:SEL1-like repeat protein [Coralloluteibacterium stylophorae]|uniref:Sel1 repeat family protein n=2 Tax=Coralloluteibacterium stylophorae TaxID=1776034 RepID=A0AAP2CD23_9GAMM|nr:SEL1-like repeat protein [Coralloluteibacterium stylophorae]MBS7458663.1 sel1 repeat family protein [Coralloluteibacterium stylophorae]
MVAAGVIYHQGLGRPVDYDKALDWYLKSMDGDALNNMGVMFRDGTGVPQNAKIAYLMFLTVHMTGMGSEATIMRANRNLRASIAALPREEIDEALCYTVDYFMAYIESRGRLADVPQDLQVSPARRRIRELGWWREGELAPYDCPAGT